MACNSVSISGTQVAAASKDGVKEQKNLGPSFSGKDLCERTKIRRSYSDNHLCQYSVNRIRASAIEPKLKNSPSMGIFNFHLPGSIFPNSIRSFLFDPVMSKGINIEETSVESDDQSEMEIAKKRVNWVERLVEIRSLWRNTQQKDRVVGDGEEDESWDKDDNDEGGCKVEYCSDEEEQLGKISTDRESFSRLLVRVSSSDAKLFSQLAFLCNMAYVITEIKAKDLRRYYGLDFVTSSLGKKADAATLKAKLDHDSTRVPTVVANSVAIELSNSEKTKNSERKRLMRPSVAYEIAASAASYVQSRAKDLLSLGPDLRQQEGDGNGANSHSIKNHLQEEEGSSPSRVYKSEVAAYVAASTMTAVVAAGEKQKQEAAKDLQSPHSSPCEWFVCDDSSTCTRYFVTQGSDSLASWQANLFFEPTKFEGTEVLVHRGIYEAAKGMYEQFMPEIMEHLNKYGNDAKLQFTGHSLGGSLSFLVNLMLLLRKVIKPSALLPVVTFGSPFVFCGGQKILDELGLDENHVHCVMMHRDIVPRAFSCNYPNRAAQLLKRLSASFRSHPCLSKNKLLYSPMGKIFILQPDENTSPPHPFLPIGSALYALESGRRGSTESALRAFLNNPHPLDTLSDPTAYGSDGTILRDHDSSNYLKAVNAIIRRQTKMVSRRERKQRSLLWPLLTSQSPHSWKHEHNNHHENNRLVNEVMSTQSPHSRSHEHNLENNRLVNNELLTTV